MSCFNRHTLSLVLLLSATVLRSADNRPIIPFDPSVFPDNFSVFRDLKYRQTSATGPTLDSLTFVMAKSDGGGSGSSVITLPDGSTVPVTTLPTLPDDVRFVIKGPSKEYVLEHASDTPAEGFPGRGSFRYAENVGSPDEFQRYFPNGEYAFTSTYLPNGAQNTTRVQITYPAPMTPARITNWDDVQKWSGGALVVAWTPFGGATAQDNVMLEIRRADGSVAYLSPPAPAANRLTGTSNIAALVGVSSTIGETLRAKLSAYKIVQPVSATTPAFVAERITLEFTIVRPAPLPTISASPRGVTLANAAPLALSVTASGIGLKYQWQRDGVDLTGATTANFVIATPGPQDAGAYRVAVSNTGGVAWSETAVVAITGPATRPMIVEAPKAQSLNAGSALVLAVSAAGSGPTTYQWNLDGRPLAGATASTLRVHSIRPRDAGSYTVTLTNPAGITTSEPARVEVIPATRIANLSILSSLASAEDSFSLGYVVGGAGTSRQVPKPLVIRAVGPSLAPLGVADVLLDPRMDLFGSGMPAGSNDNWGGSAALVAGFAAVGAFPLGSGSLDAAVLVQVSTPDNTVRVSGHGAGAVIGEIYDATEPDVFVATTPRLINVSVLKQVGGGLTAGLVVTGMREQKILFRAVGPTLAEAPFQVAGVLSDPAIVLYAGASQLATNDNWSGTDELARTFSAVGAFGLRPTSRDAALLATLRPGTYTVRVTRAAEATDGLVLLEIYEVP